MEDARYIVEPISEFELGRRWAIETAIAKGWITEADAKRWGLI